MKIDEPCKMAQSLLWAFHFSLYVHPLPQLYIRKCSGQCYYPRLGSNPMGRVLVQQAWNLGLIPAQHKPSMVAHSCNLVGAGGSERFRLATKQIWS